MNQTSGNPRFHDHDLQTPALQKSGENRVKQSNRGVPANVEFKLQLSFVVQGLLDQPDDGVIEFLPGFGFSRRSQLCVGDWGHESNDDPLNVSRGDARNDVYEIDPWTLDRPLD